MTIRSRFIYPDDKVEFIFTKDTHPGRTFVGDGTVLPALLDVLPMISDSTAIDMINSTEMRLDVCASCWNSEEIMYVPGLHQAIVSTGIQPEWECDALDWKTWKMLSVQLGEAIADIATQSIRWPEQILLNGVERIEVLESADQMFTALLCDLMDGWDYAKLERIAHCALGLSVNVGLTRYDYGSGYFV